MAYNFKKIESKWQKKWEEKKVFAAKDFGKKKYYVLEMYPYPSGDGLHMGHAFNYTIGDILARYKRMHGFNVLHPIGFDSFGLPAENAAILAKSHPKKFTDKVITNYIKQLKMLGISYDWSRRLESHDVNYYKWNQWIFLKLYEKGFAYKKKSQVNFCKKCNTVLANEQVHNGKCWRHSDTNIEIKQLEQWFIRITDYAEELLRDIDTLDWPERIKTMQRNWIGRSEGTEINFEINGKTWSVFTTRPDTIFGITFMVVSAQHSELDNLVTNEQKKSVEVFLKKIRTTRQEDLDKLEKDGVFSGSYAIHPLTKEKIPVWIGNFVLAEYGSGMVMGVPAHDQRDFDFSRKYGLKIREVISGGEINKKPYMGPGRLVNSKGFDKLENREAKEHITNYLKNNKIGRKTVQYKMRDWLVSRQRYWGTPIPMLYDENREIFPVKEKDLPVRLPEEVQFGKGNPLETSKNFLNFKKNGKNYRRETDTMDTFFDSSWYFFRFTDPKNTKKLFDPKKVNYWSPVDFYTGGAEHACMHLLYARFLTKFLRDQGLIDKKVGEPFTRLFNQGMVHGDDGFVMSKSRGNVIDPSAMVEKYGADSLRIFLISMASPDSDFVWNTTGLESINKFVKKMFDYFSNVRISKSDRKIQSKVHKSIKGITKDIESLKYNFAIIKIRELFEYLNNKEISKKDIESCIKLLSLFTPHIAEEIWEKLGNKGFVSSSDWPKYDEKKIDKSLEKEEEIIEGIKIDTIKSIGLSNEKTPHTSYFPVTDYTSNILKENLDFLKNTTGSLTVNIYSPQDVKSNPSIDPMGKLKRSKPEKPGIYISGTQPPSL